MPRWILESFHNNKSDDAQNIPSKGHFRIKHIYPPVLKVAEGQDFSSVSYICECSMAHTKSVPPCLHTQLRSTWVNMQLPQGTKSSNQIPCTANQQLHIWIPIYQSSYGSLLGWLRRSTQWYTKKPFFMHQCTFLLCVTGLNLSGDIIYEQEKPSIRKQTYAERHPAA